MRDAALNNIFATLDKHLLRTVLMLTHFLQSKRSSTAITTCYNKQRFNGQPVYACFYCSQHLLVHRNLFAIHFPQLKQDSFVSLKELSNQLDKIQVKRCPILFDCQVISGKYSAKQNLAPKTLLKREKILYFFSCSTMCIILILCGAL